MSKAGKLVSQLFSIRNSYGKKISSKKLYLLKAISNEKLTSKKDVELFHSVLLFLMAYPDDQAVYKQSSILFQQLHLYIKSHKKLRDDLYNSGITNTQLCAAYSFQIVKWMTTNYKKNIRIRSFEAS